MKWWIGATAKGIDRDKVIKAVRNAQSEWNNNINWCGIKDQANIPAHYEGKTSAARSSTTGRASSTGAAWRTIRTATGRSPAPEPGTTSKGNPVESDIRFNTAFKWSAKGAAGAYDIQSVAAHEFGHVFQFDHVTNSSKHDNTNLMWPYLDIGRHERAQARPRRRDRGQQPLLRNVWRDGDRIVQVGQHLGSS